MKIYTRQGDSGETSLFGGVRVPKHALRIEAYGTVDELNAALGVARSLNPPPPLDSLLTSLQNALFVLGADLATPHDSNSTRTERVTDAHVQDMERHIDSFDASLSPLKRFILPGGTPLAAQLHVARTVCRRAERLVARLAREEEIGSQPLIFLNRLSDLLFVMARAANQSAGVADTPWEKEP